MTPDDGALTDCGAPPDETAYWDRVAERTTWGRYLAARETNVMLRGLELAGSPGHALDLGCGGGRWTKFLADRGWSVTAVDIDPQSLAICQRKAPRARCVLTTPDSRRLPIADGSQRFALCMEVPQVIESDWLPHELYRVLSDEGLVMGVQFNLNSWRCAVWRWKRRITGWLGDGSYTMSYADWRRRFLSAGFEMVHEESCCWGPFSRVSNSALVPVFAKAERAFGLSRLVRWGPWILFVARKVGTPSSPR